MNSSVAEFEKEEDYFQKQFDNFQMPSIHPRLVFTVELLEFRNITTGWFKDLFDIPDPQIIVTCPKIEIEHLRTFKTSVFPNTTSGFVGESFKFVAPKHFSVGESFPIEIGICDQDMIIDDVIGKRTIDASKLPSKVHQITLKFGENEEELDIRISRDWKTNPDFRYSVGLSHEEKSFRKKRVPIVYNAMRTVLGDAGPNNLSETPIVSLCGSGGGYRALIGMCGAMEALKDSGLQDVFTYNCGLSGSSWYFTSAYILRGVKANEQSSFHSKIRRRLESDLKKDAINPMTINAYQKYLNEHRKNVIQPHTIVDYFPGFLVGKQLLLDEKENTFRDVIPYIDNGNVPYPILVALNVKNHMEASLYHAYIEKTPHEISLPSYGINIESRYEGAAWDSGVLVRKFPELPIHFTLGMTGCAFSILLDSFFTDGHEAGPNTLERNDLPEHEKETSLINSLIYGNAEELSKEVHLYIFEKVKNSTLFNTRSGVIDRTALLLNFTLGLEIVERYLLNPFGEFVKKRGTAADVLERFGVEEVKEHISTDKNTLAFADAGIFNNVPTNVILRPQRSTDVLIVMDFTAYDSDNDFHYRPLLDAAKHAWQSGLEFPNIDFEEISKLPPKEFLLFPSDGPNCPSVLWFTLSNNKFKQEKKYFSKSSTLPPDGEERNFNDFTVFGEDSCYSTFTFQYDGYSFDQLKELMYFNVKSHIDEIKQELANAVQRKRRKNISARL